MSEIDKFYANLAELRTTALHLLDQLGMPPEMLITMGAVLAVVLTIVAIRERCRGRSL
jgi:hypothetical protein